MKGKRSSPPCGAKSSSLTVASTASSPLRRRKPFSTASRDTSHMDRRGIVAGSARLRSSTPWQLSSNGRGRPGSSGRARIRRVQPTGAPESRVRSRQCSECASNASTSRPSSRIGSQPRSRQYTSWRIRYTCSRCESRRAPGSARTTAGSAARGPCRPDRGLHRRAQAARARISRMRSALPSKPMPGSSRQRDVAVDDLARRRESRRRAGTGRGSDSLPPRPRPAAMASDIWCPPCGMQRAGDQPCSFSIVERAQVLDQPVAQRAVELQPVAVGAHAAVADQVARVLHREQVLAGRHRARRSASPSSACSA